MYHSGARILSLWTIRMVMGETRCFNYATHLMLPDLISKSLPHICLKAKDSRIRQLRRYLGILVIQESRTKY